MSGVNFIGPIGVIIFLICSYYSFKISNDFFIKDRKENNAIKKLLIKHMIAFIILSIILFILYKSDRSIFLKYESLYLSLNIIVIDFNYFNMRLKDEDLKRSSRIEKLKKTAIISIMSSVVLGIIDSIKYGSVKYSIPYIVIALIVILIEGISFIKNKKVI